MEKYWSWKNELKQLYRIVLKIKQRDLKLLSQIGIDINKYLNISLINHQEHLNVYQPRVKLHGGDSMRAYCQNKK